MELGQKRVYSTVRYYNILIKSSGEAEENDHRPQKIYIPRM